MDKIDATIIDKICSKYKTIFELLMDVESYKQDIIKKAWDNELTEFYSGKRKRFETVKEINIFYYIKMKELLDDIMKESPSIYNSATLKLNELLRLNPTYFKKAGLIVHQDDKYSNTEYYVNYLFSEKALSRCKALIDSFGIK